MKIIEPLFLNDLKEAFEKSKGNQKKREELLKRLRTIKIFDPACGSGNFLIIAYKELRKLEMEIFKEQRSTLPISGISLRQFYGIELDDFAHEVTQLSLWLAEHQMNMEFFKRFGRTNPTLPLKEAGNIVQGNACRINWETLCPKKEGDEIYILGNPPYLGSNLQSKVQKDDMSFTLSSIKGYKNLDYISCWFFKGSNFISNINAKLAFVSTNSICQGEQVDILWSVLLREHIEIGFAYPSFKWSNNARGKAGVTVVIVGLRNIEKTSKYIFQGKNILLAQNISPYLVEGKNLIITKRGNPLSELKPMSYGSKAVDGGNLILNGSEKISIVEKNPGIIQYIKKFIGSDEFINGIDRWCFWIEDNQKEEAIQILEIKGRVEAVRNIRLKSEKKATQESAVQPHAFGERRFSNTNSIIIPSVSSERRKYLPVGFLDANTVISNSAHCLLNASPVDFGIISSKMHITWIKSVCGCLESRIRYSSSLGYNTFPFQSFPDNAKKTSPNVYFAFWKSGKNIRKKLLAQLYDPDKMPEGLREAHRLNDLAVERCYRSKPFESDEERLEYLFKLYEKMNAEQQENKSCLRAKIKL